MEIISNNDQHKNVDRAELMAAMLIRRAHKESLLNSVPQERGRAYMNNPAHWVFMDTEKASELL